VEPPALRTAPTSQISPPPDRVDVVVGLAANTYADTWRLGPTAEAGLQLRLGRWVVPLLLRYELSYRSLRLPPGHSPVVENTFHPDFALAASSNLEARFDGNAASTASFHTLGLQTGVGRQLGRRWRVSTGVGVHYLAGGQVPTLRPVSLASGNTVGYQFDLQTLNQTAATAALTDPRLSSAADQLETFGHQVRRWEFGGWLRADYTVYRKWSVGIEAGHQFQSAYDDNLLQEGRARVVFGLRKRW
jgi:hypothetical protein